MAPLICKIWRCCKKKYNFGTSHPRLSRLSLLTLHFRHPSVLRTFGFFQDNGSIYSVMEYAIKGGLYQLMMNETFVLAENRACKVRFLAELRYPEYLTCFKFIAGVASGLAHLHRNGVTGANIGPEYLFYTPDGNVIIGDFYNRMPR
jgi:serine/threonine protein kinase